MKRLIITAVLIIGIIAGLVLATRLGFQKPETTIIPEFGISSQVTAEVNKYLSTNIISSDKKVTVFIPANAISDDGYISLTTMKPNLFTEPDGEWYRPIVVNLDVYDPLGKLVSKPTITRLLDICFLLSEEERAGFQINRENYYIQYYEEKQSEKSWKKTEYSSKTNNQQLCGEINNLTLISLAIRREVRIPTPLELQKPTPFGGLYRYPIK